MGYLKYWFKDDMTRTLPNVYDKDFEERTFLTPWDSHKRVRIWG